MTWLFLRFYVAVLVVLFLAWWIHGLVLKQRAEADTQRVIVAAHTGGARLVARELDGCPPEAGSAALDRLRARFAYPIDVVPMSELAPALQHELSHLSDVAYTRFRDGHCVVTSLSGGQDVVRLGPFPNYDLREIEEAIGGWMRLAAEQLGDGRREDRADRLAQLSDAFTFPVELADCQELPAWPRERLAGGDDVAFYPAGDDRWCAVTPLAGSTQVMRFGPFPSFEHIEEKAATTTLTLVLLPVALAIALLLRPVARQLRHVEHAALAIAAGDLSARVDTRRVRSARSLAVAFNDMASRTEAMVRTQRELLQAVSHELRTPLARMRFAIDLIAAAKDEAERTRRLESLDAATEELDALVGELLSYVRLETNPPQVELQSIAVRELLLALRDKYAALHPQVHFEVDVDCGDEQSIVAERAGLQRALGNLLSNAGRHAKQRVLIHAHSTDVATTIDIDDDGTGIPESDRERVFEPFVRLAADAPHQGVGLGLALVRRIVMQHGGSVNVLSSPLGGCRVRTTWPGQA